MGDSRGREDARPASPAVSIVLPCHDGADHLDEAVRSVLAQTEKDWELLLVDDGSSDGSGALIDAWSERDPRIRAIHLPSNRGLPAALNEGFRHARGPLLSWTSDDNRYEPDALARMRAWLDAHPHVDVVHADYVRFDAAGGETRVRVAPASSLPRANGIGACFLYRREVHEELGGFDESLCLAEDYDFWLRASARFRFAALHECLYRYRDHDASLTARRGADVERAAWRAVERHLPALPPEVRADARLHWARRQFAWGEAARARENVRRALAEAPRVARRRAHRGAVARAALGRRPARALERALGLGTPDAVALFIQPDFVGGITSFVRNLVSARPDDALPVEVRWSHDRRSPLARAPLPASRERREGERHVRVDHHHPDESLFSTLRRLRRGAHRGPGVVVASDYLGLAYAAWADRDKALVQVVHSDAAFPYRTAERFAPHVDAFVAVSSHIRDALRRRLPERADDVHWLPVGVPLPERTRAAAAGAAGPLRLVYTGRLDDAQKGVLQLPEIDRRLREAGVAVRWTVVGDGPERTRLREAFGAADGVRFTGALPAEAVAGLLPDHDVLVLPSRVEGLPVSLLEAMGAGLVPVASDLRSGMRDVIEPGANGLLAPVDSPRRFAEAIAGLARDRRRLERMSDAAARTVRTRFEARSRSAAFFGLLADLAAAPRPPRERPPLRRGPGRLDRPWLPGPLVRAVRCLARGAGGGPAGGRSR